MIPKAELHVHLEGTAAPSLIKRMALRRNHDIPDHLFKSEHHFAWDDFLSFLKAYDLASSVIKTPDDYCEVTYDYLKQSAQEGVIYAELMASPDHAALAGMSYVDQVTGIAEGIQRAHAEYGIEARIICTGVRHFGVEKVIEVAKLAAKYPHPFVVGFGLGGDEVAYPASLFKKAYLIAAEEAGLNCTTHAGEMGGADSIKDAIQHLPLKRIGHGVRIIEDINLMDEIRDRNIALECCPTSNIKLNVFAHYQFHPLRKIYDHGIPLSLNSDDPPYFETTMGYEYEVAKTYFRFSDQELLHITQMAIEHSFADELTKQRLLNSLNKQAA